MLSFKEIKAGLFSYEEADRGHVIAIKTAADLLKGAEKVKQAGVKHFDCYTPFPIHGLDIAMGLHRSWIPFVTLLSSLMALILGVSYIFYIDVIDWSIVYGGKPYFSGPAYVPILFELAVYFAAVAAVASVIVLGKLGTISRKPILPNVTSDGFAIWIGDNLSEAEIKNILGNLGDEIHPVTK